MSLSRPLIVGSWRGSNNEYLRLFCESLRVNGIVVEDIKWPWECFGKRIDVLHIHWLEQAFGEVHQFIGLARAIAVILALIVLRLRGVKVVWCVHNLEPHDARRHLLLFWWFYAGFVGYLVDGFVTLSPSTVEIARAHFSGLRKKPATFAWHPRYPITELIPEEPAWRARHGMNSSMTVLAFVGGIRPYKGLEELITSFLAVHNPDMRLVIAGRLGKSGLRILLERAVAIDRRIVLDLRWLSERELQETALAADVLVFPFAQTLHSGSVVYGLSCGRAVITPAVDYANDLLRHVGSQWIRTYEPPLSAATLTKFCKRANGQPDLGFLSVYESGAKLKAFYENLVA